jgi:putative flippase GtrA
MDGVKKRPAEVTAGLVIAAAVFGFLSEAGVSEPIAAVIAIAIAFVPGAVSYVVDAVRGA